MELSAAMVDRAVGAVLASAMGDAMGAPYEFGSPDPTALCELEGGGVFGWAPGEWTDDTQMAVAVLSVLGTGSTDIEEIGRAMVRWYESGPGDVGNQTRGVLGAASRSGNSAADAAAAYQRQHPDAAGNGALMRTGPVALARLGNREAVARLAALVASLTHPHPDSVDACVLWSLAIERAITTATADVEFDWRTAVLHGLDHLDVTRRDTWRTRLDDAHGRDPKEFAKSNGWVVDAFLAAYAAITSTPVPPRSGEACGHLADSLRLASRSGGDTDTVAAIVGALLGARWGATAIPLSMRRKLHGRRTYDMPDLRAGDLDTMARLAIRGGQPDSAGWPGVETMVPYYAANFGSRPLVKKIDRAWFGNAAGLPEALEQGATTVVSLCRMGTADVPAEVRHLTVALLDTTREDNSNLTFVLADTARNVAELVDSGERVFVHCVAAENRTPAVAAAYLMVRGIERDAALERIAAQLGRMPQRFLIDGLPSLTVSGRADPEPS